MFSGAIRLCCVARFVFAINSPAADIAEQQIKFYGREILQFSFSLKSHVFVVVSTPLRSVLSKTDLFKSTEIN